MKFFQFIIAATIVTIVCEPVAVAQTIAIPSSQPSKPAVDPRLTQKDQSPDNKLVRLRRRYIAGDLNDEQMWEQLTKLFNNIGELSPEGKAQLLQTQAHILYRSNFRILAAIYATQSIRSGKNPLGRDVARSWEILNLVSEERPIQNLLEVFSLQMALGGKTPPYFGSNWYFWEASALDRAGKREEALAKYKMIKIKDRLYMPALYQMAMIEQDADKTDAADKNLKTILLSQTQDLSPLNGKRKEKIINYAKLALARIAYQNRKFIDAIKYYRAVDRKSNLFYDALFEQSWALFMAGFPNHSLGILYGVNSPFFTDRFNPEATILRSIVFYWICRYDDSKAALAEFTEKHKNAVKSLDDFLQRGNVSDTEGYMLFENFVTGVTSDTLGVSKDVLATAANQDTMLLVRDQYASLLEERKRLMNEGIFSNSKDIQKPQEYIDRWMQAVKRDIANQFIVELKVLKKEFERLNDQAQFLYLELLMSEKEKILGRDLHGDSKLNKVPEKDEIKHWSRNAMSWGDSRKNEYWLDELGYHIYQANPECESSKSN